MLREIPRRDWKSSKRRTPRKASRTISRLHHSPTTSRHWATEQFIVSKLVRFMTLQHSGLHERTHFGIVRSMNELTRPSTRWWALGVLCLPLVVITVDT